MIPVIEKYNYVPMEREEINGRRHYIDPTGNSLPSVTTILSETKDMKGLNSWKKFVGQKEADRIVKEATDLGSLMHENMESWIQGVERPRGNNLIRVMARNMADQIIQKGLVHVDEVWGIETGLYYPGLYAGTTDLCGIYKGVPAIMDHKTANKMKKPEHVQDYFCQGVAYCEAHNHLYGTDIKRVVLFMVDRDLNYKEWMLEGNEYDTAYDRWLTRLEQYYG